MKKTVSGISFWCFLSINALIPTLLTAQNDSIPHRKLLLFPVIAKSIETGWSFGAFGSFTFRPFASDTVSRTSSLQALALYTTKKQLVTALNGSQYFFREKYILNEQISFSSFPDKFWGLGNQTKDADQEPYRYKQYYIYAHLLRKLNKHWFAGIIFENQKVWDVQYTAGGKFDQQVYGKDGYHVAGIGGSLTFDNRTNAFAPDNGIFCQFTFNHFDQYLQSDYVYTNYVVDIRKFIPVAHRSDVLALQLYSFNNSGEVPIRSLASFGGANRMRGYYDGRYKDWDMFVVQGEYRMHVSGRIGLVFFAGTGTVGRQWQDYGFDNLKYSYGTGLRIAVDQKEKLNVRIDYGIGQGKNNGLYLQLGEAF